MFAVGQSLASLSNKSFCDHKKRFLLFTFQHGTDVIRCGDSFYLQFRIVTKGSGFGTGSFGKHSKIQLFFIGKNIVRSMLEAAGFDVLDLGIDVPAEKIIETAKAEDIHIVALSGVLTLAIDSMKATIEAFAQAGLRDDVKIIIGGAPVNEEVCEQTGADAWTTSPQTTIDYCTTWAEAVY